MAQAVSQRVLRYVSGVCGRRGLRLHARACVSVCICVCICVCVLCLCVCAVSVCVRLWRSRVGFGGSGNGSARLHHRNPRTGYFTRGLCVN